MVIDRGCHHVGKGFYVIGGTSHGNSHTCHLQHLDIIGAVAKANAFLPGNPLFLQNLIDSHKLIVICIEYIKAEMILCNLDQIAAQQRMLCKKFLQERCSFVIRTAL